MAGLREEISKFLVSNMQAEQIRHTAEKYLSGFNVRRFAGVSQAISLTKISMAEAVLDYINRDEGMLDYVAHLMRLDGRGAGSAGMLHLRNLDAFLQKIRNFGWNYNQHFGRFEKDQSRVKTRDWGILRHNRYYHIAFVDLDLVKSSELSRHLDVRTLSDLFSDYRAFAEEVVHLFDGRVWEWSGDGFLVAFQGQNSTERAFRFALSFLRRLVLFQYRFGRLVSGQELRVRIGADFGESLFDIDHPGENEHHALMARKLQEEISLEGSLSVTGHFYQTLSPEYQAFFREGDVVIDHESVFSLREGGRS